MYIADLHIHSRYARATSRDCDAPHLDLWARKKGIALLGTGDFTHPAWRAELEEQLAPAEEGFYKLKPEHALPGAPKGEARFVLSTEISSIYKKGGRVRKVHNVILLPDFDSARRLSARLEAIGNLHSDGRPILGLDARDLLEIALDACPQAIFIPAHIWTPHFSLFGAFSGFDTIEECFGSLSGEIHALETGLSSDPPMNWRVPQLDGFTLVSNSDAHSPQKLGREANLLDTALSYPALKRAIETGEGFAGTLEFFPEEGKYHLDGHRNCGVVLAPAEAQALGGICPVCGKRLTIGVQHRVEELAGREEGFCPANAKPFESLAPLPEVIGSSSGYSEGSKKVQACYEHMLAELGPEFTILRQTPLEDIRRVAGPAVAEGLRRLRLGEVQRKAGFDGQFGSVILLTPGEVQAFQGQTTLFQLYGTAKPKQKPKAKALPQPPKAGQAGAAPALMPNEGQLAAAQAPEPVVAVIAGPGAGKTKTLADRVEYLLTQRGVKPRQVMAVTFTNQAAGELRQRLAGRLGGKRAVSGMAIGTFHSICWQLLGRPALISESEALALAGVLLEGRGLPLTPRQLVEEVSRRKNGLPPQHGAVDGEILAGYRALLAGRLDFDDLLLQALGLPPGSARLPAHLLVDEFQDCNSLQYRLALHWAQPGGSLFVIGDPDQSIYGFRGAMGHCFRQLEEDRPGLRTIRLGQNYRSTPQILESALSLISHNPGGERGLSTPCPAGPAVRWAAAKDGFSEAWFLSKEIAAMAGGVDMLGARQRERYYAFSEIAVLVRTRRQLETIERALRREDIPCVVGGREDFLQEKAVQGTVAFFRFLLGFSAPGATPSPWPVPQPLAAPATLPADSGAWSLGIGGPPALAHPQPMETIKEGGAGTAPSAMPGQPSVPANNSLYALGAALSTCLELLWACPAYHRETAAACCRETPPGDATALRQRLGAIPAMGGFLDAVDAYLPRLKEKPEKLLESWEAQWPRAKGLGKLRGLSSFSGSMAEFLELLALGEESDLRRPSGKGYASGAVYLSTLHGAKGLEFPVVFLAGLKQGLLPLETAKGEADVEEERRLLYVGITRAREELILLSPGEPSPFIGELGPLQKEAIPAYQRPAQQLSLF